MSETRYDATRSVPSSSIIKDQSMYIHKSFVLFPIVQITANLRGPIPIIDMGVVIIGASSFLAAKLRNYPVPFNLKSKVGNCGSLIVLVTQLPDT